MALSNPANIDEKDINDVFSDIALTEQNSVEEGYEEGLTDGIAAGNTEGYHLGYHRGAELGAEIGYYTGIVEWHLRLSKSEKIQSVLTILKQSLDTFPRTNDEKCDIFELANQIRAQFKKACALLKINGRYPEADTLNF